MSIPKFPSFFWGFLIVVVCSVLAYFPAVVHLTYVWDDNIAFTLRPELREASLAWHAIWQPILPGAGYFRPLVMATFVVQFLTVGLTPWVAHLVNFLIQTLNALLVYVLATKYGSDLKGSAVSYRAMFAALIYALNPALIEPTAWAMGRFDLMATTFLLIGLLGLLSLQGGRRLVVCGLSYALALLSKEEALIFIPLVLLHLQFGYRTRTLVQSTDLRSKRDGFILVGMLLIVTIGYFLLRHAMIPVSIARVDPNIRYFLGTPAKYFAHIGLTGWSYVQLTVWPLGYFGTVHKTPLLAWTQADMIWGYVALVVGVSTTVLLLFLRTRAALLILAWVVALLPVLNIIPLTMANNIIQDRFVTFPSVFYCIALSRFSLSILPVDTFRLSEMFRTWLLPILASFYVLMLIVMVRLTVPLWTNNVTLWAWGLAQNPNDPIARFNYISACIQLNRPDLAAAFFKKYPVDDSVNIRAMHANFLLNLGKTAEAVQMFQFIFQHTSNQPSPQLIALIMQHPEMHQTDVDANLVFRQYLYTEMAIAYRMNKDYANALKFARIATFYSYHYYPAWEERSMAAYALDDWAAGNVAYARARQYAVVIRLPVMNKNHIDFLNTLCQPPIHTPDVCAHWRGGAVPSVRAH